MEADATKTASPPADWTFTEAEPDAEHVDNDGIAILPRDPNTVFVYWDLTRERMQMVERHYGVPWESLRKGLRIYDVNAIRFDGDIANRIWDIDLTEGATQWFIGGLLPDCRYIVDFGVRKEEGGFLTLLRSHTSPLPPDRPFLPGAMRPGEGRYAAREAGKPDWLDRFTGYSLIESKPDTTGEAASQTR